MNFFIKNSFRKKKENLFSINIKFKRKEREDGIASLKEGCLAKMKEDEERCSGMKKKRMN